MGVQQQCRHYLQRSTASGDSVQRCRLGAAKEEPSFACPDSCMFFEERSLSGAGWVQAPTQRMSNTADGLPDPPAKRKQRPRRRR